MLAAALILLSSVLSKNLALLLLLHRLTLSNAALRDKNKSTHGKETQPRIPNGQLGNDKTMHAQTSQYRALIMPPPLPPPPLRTRPVPSLRPRVVLMPSPPAAAVVPSRTHGRVAPQHIPPDDLPAHIGEDLVDVGLAAGAGLVIRRVAPLLGDGEGPRAGDLAVFFEVGFVAHQHYGDVGVVFQVHELFAELVEFGERGHGCYAEDEEETLAGLHVDFAHGG